ncbi:TonB-dependent receptor [Flavobacterium sp. 7A]|uniref:TonB-dependent receptor n=1 Tax=Flavobacterium sp. 7A TaxID=2940571 RepID=UPI002226C765|nr:TonB-dependent receptor [Flavobacterium sp. 7A]MCW2118112.1 iron complex outermembrane receptor protein [Flavobacterium sp. 7A]
MITKFISSCLKGTRAQSKPLVLSVICYLFSFFSFAQVKDSTNLNKLDEVLISAIRVNDKTPMSFSNLDKKDIAPRNLGQDIPILMNYMPSVVTTSDAGTGVGYTGIRVRGSDATRVNVTINGIPYNDSESHGTFWVNMPDFASSVQSLQLQRGVGTSTNGAGAFGASLNMLTDNYAKASNGEVSNSYGSFNTQKHTVKFSTGLMNDHFELAGRLSTLKSDGYVDRASSDLKSYFLQGTYIGNTTLIKALVFGGTERTYQSWNGVDAATLATDRTYNSSGEKFDDKGNLQGFYNNQVDNYQQDHAQLHWNEKVSKHWNTNLAFHYTKGKGYYEEFVDDYKYTSIYYEDDAQYSFLGLDPITVNGKVINSTDYTRRKWLNNDFYGTTFSANYKEENLDVILGGGVNRYEGMHYTELLWLQYPSNSQYGDLRDVNKSTKNDANFFAKANYQITDKISFYGDLQLRNVHYKANSVDTGLVNDSFNFFNPKAGLNYDLNKYNKFYFSYARANREPNRSDYKGGSVKPEKLNDFELGWRFGTSKSSLNVNGYYMGYKDQLVLTGKLDNVGNPIRKNVGKSYRLGLEIDANFLLNKKWSIRPNITLSDNKNVNFNLDNDDGTVTNLGNTDIAFSPKLIAGNSISYTPIANLQLNLLSKFVGSQFLNNIEDHQGELANYFVNDFNVSYTIFPKSVFKSITINGLLNNFLNRSYVSNGADYGGGYVYYYPQAGINVLVGMTLKF